VSEDEGSRSTPTCRTSTRVGQVEKCTRKNGVNLAKGLSKRLMKSGFSSLISCPLSHRRRHLLNLRFHFYLFKHLQPIPDRSISLHQEHRLSVSFSPSVSTTLIKRLILLACLLPNGVPPPYNHFRGFASTLEEDLHDYNDQDCKSRVVSCLFCWLPNLHIQATPESPVACRR